MANKKVTLVRLCKTEQGWRRYPAVTGRNGRVKPGWVRVGGVERYYPEGRYQLRTYEGSKMVYRDAGEHAADAAAEKEKTEKKLVAKEHAKAGLQIIEEEGRLNLRTELRKFLTATTARGSVVAAGVYEQAAEDFLTVTGCRYADEITKDEIAQFLRSLRSRELSDRTVANRHNRLMAFMRWLKLDTKALSPHPPRFEKALPEIYRDEELRQFFERIDDERLAIAFELFLKSGMREQEAIFLTWPRINFERGYARIRSNEEYGFKVKDKEARDIPLPPDLIKKLQVWKEKHPESKLVLGTESGKPDTKLLRSLKRAVKRVGLNCGECDGCQSKSQECEHWYLHKFRATFVTKLLRSGMDLRTVMKLSGHSDLESVMRYLSPPTDEQIQEHIQEMVWIGKAERSKPPADAARPKPRLRRDRSGYSSRSGLKASVRT